MVSLTVSICKGTTHLVEEISFTFWTGVVAPVSVDILLNGIIIIKIATKSIDIC